MGRFTCANTNQVVHSNNKNRWDDGTTPITLPTLWKNESRTDLICSQKSQELFLKVSKEKKRKIEKDLKSCLKRQHQLGISML